MNLDPTIFNAHDIRGAAPEQLKGDIACQIYRKMAEPLLRLNVEADTKQSLKARTEEIKKIIRG